MSPEDRITQSQPNGEFVCRPIEGYQCYAIMASAPPATNGPWSIVFDEPSRDGGHGFGPPPVLTAVGAFAA